MSTLEMEWDEMRQELREHLFCDACMNSKLAFCEWAEFQEWEKIYIRESAEKHGIKIIE